MSFAYVGLVSKFTCSWEGIIYDPILCTLDDLVHLKSREHLINYSSDQSSPRLMLFDGFVYQLGNTRFFVVGFLLSEQNSLTKFTFVACLFGNIYAHLIFVSLNTSYVMLISQIYVAI